MQPTGFFNNEAVDWRAILGAHIDCAIKRMATHEVVLCIQDTTELDFNDQQASGLGPLSFDAQRGMYAHPTYAVSASREPLGRSMLGNVGAQDTPERRHARRCEREPALA